MPNGINLTLAYQRECLGSFHADGGAKVFYGETYRPGHGRLPVVKVREDLQFFQADDELLAIAQQLGSDPSGLKTLKDCSPSRFHYCIHTHSFDVQMLAVLHWPHQRPERLRFFRLRIAKFVGRMGAEPPNDRACRWRYGRVRLFSIATFDKLQLDKFQQLLLLHIAVDLLLGSYDCECANPIVPRGVSQPFLYWGSIAFRRFARRNKTVHILLAEPHLHIPANIFIVIF
jgi:hypothetical protein